jgi:hypothetical protein
VMKLKGFESRMNRGADRNVRYSILPACPEL